MTEIALQGQVLPAVTQSGDPRNTLHALVRGSPPVRHWAELVDWLRGRGESNALVEATGTWLVSRGSGSEHTRDAYAADLSRWFTWCDARGTHPVTARNQEADLYAAACREAGLAKATIGRRLAAASSWHIYALRAEIATINPFQGMERPKVPAISSTRAMSKRELAALLAYAQCYREDEAGTAQAARDAYRHSLEGPGGPLSGYDLSKMFGHAGKVRVHETWGNQRIREVREGWRPAGEEVLVAKRAYALLMTMTATASRIGAILSADADGFGHDSGYRVLDLTVKGDERKRFVMPPPAVAALEDYLDGREEGPLFITANGGRLTQPYVGRLIKRLAAQAGIPQAVDLLTHSMRHSVATILLSNGTELQIVQGLLGHVNAATTQRYNHALASLENSPAGKMTDLIAAEMRILEAENE